MWEDLQVEVQGAGSFIPWGLIILCSEEEAYSNSVFGGGVCWVPSSPFCSSPILAKSY